jgi:DnaJ-class molecular chaperone
MKGGAAHATPWQGRRSDPGASWGPAAEAEPDPPDRIVWAYAVLGVSRDASDDEIRGAYKAASKKHHPDRATDTNDAEARTEKLKMINVAKQIIWKERGL